MEVQEEQLKRARTVAKVMGFVAIISIMFISYLMVQKSAVESELEHLAQELEECQTK